MAILAQGIENLSTFQSCQRSGLKLGMGNFISQPIPSQDISFLIQKSPCLKQTITASQQVI